MPVIPGDKLAVIEEFEPGEGTYVIDGAIRAHTVGEIHKDMEHRRIAVIRKKSTGVPRSGDTILGQVEGMQAGLANIRIHRINNQITQRGFVGLILLRQERSKPMKGAKNRVRCKVGDLVRVKVASNLGMNIILSIEDPSCGVIYSVCSLCGGRMNRINERLKCTECGNIEQSKLAPDYGRVNLFQT